MDNPRTTPNKGIKLFLYFLGTVGESGVQSLHKYLHFWAPFENGNFMYPEAEK
jgi:hypothetical protein